jgi:predicted alpha-1,6-mannanase (GH76 family)
MGTQQLLLIIIGMIVLAAAIVVGNLLFEAYSESTTKDSIVLESIDLGSLAQQYFNKSIEMGGGNRSFVGWQISEFLDSTSNGTYSIVLITDKKLILKGLPLADKNYDWAVRTKITKDEINTDIMD